MTDSESQGGSKRLAEIFSPCFTLILRIRSSSQFSDAETLRQSITNVISECEREAYRSNSHEDVEDAKFALVAFVDETILSSDSSLKMGWMAKPLQLQLYNRFDAGEHFFEKMSTYLGDSSRIQVLEVYYLCLTLGFKGRYQLVEQDKLRSTIEAAGSALKQSPMMKAGLLSPNGAPRDQVAAEVKNKLPTWAIVAGAVMIAVLVWVVMNFIVSGQAGDTADQIQALSGLLLPPGMATTNVVLKSKVRDDS